MSQYAFGDTGLAAERLKLLAKVLEESPERTGMPARLGRPTSDLKKPGRRLAGSPPLGHGKIIGLGGMGRLTG
jgi:hypothetical protein